MVAIALSMGGGAYASTQLAGTSQGPSRTLEVTQGQSPANNLAVGVHWTSLGLINGWVSSSSRFSSGNPRVALQNNIVYLSGSLHQATPGIKYFAVLPRAFRPAHNMWITVYTYGDTSGTLYIGKNGDMAAYASGSCPGGGGNSAQCYTSLAAVSYPVNS